MELLASAIASSSLTVRARQRNDQGWTTSWTNEQDVKFTRLWPCKASGTRDLSDSPRAPDRCIDAAHEAHIEEALDDNTASVHEWLKEKYQKRYRSGQTEICFEAVLACQNEKAPLPDWLVEALILERGRRLRPAPFYLTADVARNEIPRLN